MTMKFGLGINTSDEIENAKVDFLIILSEGLEEYLKERNYGEDILGLYIGIICVSPAFESFYPQKKKYIKSKGILEYDIKLNFQDIQKANIKKVKEIVVQALINSLITLETDYKRFDIASFKDDINHFLSKNFLNG